MRIAIVTELFYPHVGGQENRYYELSSHLSRRGHEVHIFTFKYDLDLPDEQDIDGVQIHRYGFVENYVRPGGRSFNGIVKFSFNSIPKVLVRPRFDVYLLNQWPLLHIVSLKPFCRELTVIDWCELWEGFVGLFQKTVSRLSNAHVTVSSTIRRRLIEDFWIDASKVEVIPSGINSGLYAADMSLKRLGNVLFVGRLMPHKQIGMLVDAVKMAHKIHPEICLDVVGNGPLYSALRKEIVGCDDFIRVHGWVSNSEKIELLKRAWVFALPSRREGFPRAIAEAMASGTPILTTDYLSNGACDVVREYASGYVVSPRSSLISEYLIMLFEDSALWASLAKNCMRASHSLDWGVVVDRFEAFLRTKLQGKVDG